MNHNKSLGQIGEDLAVRFLEKRGYNIEHRNLKIKYKEIDIIATKEKEIIFVEVKSRTKNDFADISQVINIAKLSNFRRAAELFLYFNYTDFSPRLDLVFIVFDIGKKSANIKHIKSIC